MTNWLSLLTDNYERKARLYPAIVLVAPVAVTLMAIVSVERSDMESIAVGIGALGGAFLLAQLARDAGKKREDALFARWGGMPSVTIWRHTSRRLDPITKARYHKKLAGLVVEANAPSVDEERAKPATADAVYAAWSRYLRARTRDTQKYALLFQENTSYGYRRNVWGLRPIGIATTVLCCSVAIFWCYRKYRATGQIDEKFAGAGAVSAVFLSLWVFQFSPGWVRIPADAYAERLAEAAETVGDEGPPGAREPTDLRRT